jgi:proline iminopeptidase
MMHRPIIVTAIAALEIAVPVDQLRAQQTERSVIAAETRISVGNTTLYSRAIGLGPPVIVLHGGPDFDHGYLLPDLDQLSDVFRLIYYDQRGRGKSAENVQPQDVTLASDLDDIDRVRRHYELGAVVLLGHSWGAVLALEYALRNPTHVSHLILTNPAPVSASDLAAVRKVYLERLGEEMDRQRAIVATAAYQAGDPEAVATRYRIHFKPSLKHPEDYEKMMARMRAGFLSQGKDGIVKARAVEGQLMRDTWEVAGYDLLPKLAGMAVPTLVIAGDHDFMVGAAERIAGAIPSAELVTIKGCGHFAFLECAGEVRNALKSFFGRPLVGRRVSELSESIALLRSDDFFERKRAVEAISRLGSDARPALPHLLCLLERETEAFDLNYTDVIKTIQVALTGVGPSAVRPWIDFMEGNELDRGLVPPGGTLACVAFAEDARSVFVLRQQVEVRTSG